VLDLDKTLLHQHTLPGYGGHTELCTRAMENGKPCGLINKEIDDIINFCIREGVPEFLQSLERLRKDGKIDILIWTKMGTPNAVIHMITLAHYANITSHLPSKIGQGLEGKGDIYRWGLISGKGNVVGPKQLSDLNGKNKLEAKGLSLHTTDEFYKSNDPIYPSYWKRGFNTDAILENVKNGIYGKVSKNIYIFDDLNENCKSDIVDGISIQVPAFTDAGDSFFELFLQILEENQSLQLQTEEYLNRLLKSFEKSFQFESKSFIKVFAKTVKTIKQMIDEEKIKPYETRIEFSGESKIDTADTNPIVENLNDEETNISFELIKTTKILPALEYEAQMKTNKCLSLFSWINNILGRN
jgi:hypothetical protein